MDAAPNGVQPALRDSMLYRFRTESELPQLPYGHHAVLTFREHPYRWLHI
jgi:hypothetical protein